MPKLLDYDPVTGVSEYYHKTDDGFAIQTVQDVTPVLEHNKRAQVDGPQDYRKGNLHEIACIPYVVLQQWHKELGDDPLAKRNRSWLKAKLNDRDNQFLRTRGGKI